MTGRKPISSLHVRSREGVETGPSNSKRMGTRFPVTPLYDRRPMRSVRCSFQSARAHNTQIVAWRFDFSSETWAAFIVGGRRLTDLKVFVSQTPRRESTTWQARRPHSENRSSIHCHHSNTRLMLRPIPLLGDTVFYLLPYTLCVTLPDIIRIIFSTFYLFVWLKHLLVLFSSFYYMLPRDGITNIRLHTEHTQDNLRR